MKYIRTKDGYIYEIETKEFGGIRKGYFKNASDNFNLHNNLREWQLDCKNQYCLDTPNGHTICENQANTIEALCDEFIIYDEENWTREFITIDFYNKTYWFKYDESEYTKPIKIKSNDEIYGAIWTDKGLIYVAKMNDKGELELL